jgi:transcriptional regulator GlxA family with amidase domain
LPDCGLTPGAGIDVLIVPGGDVSQVIERCEVIAWIRDQAHSVSILASVCTGAFLLAKAGLPDGLVVTTHWEDQHDLQAQFPALSLRADVSWVDCGKIVTSGGISAGIDMSLHLVERLAGRQLALATARQMEYRWNENGSNEPHVSGLLSAA